MQPKLPADQEVWGFAVAMSLPRKPAKAKTALSKCTRMPSPAGLLLAFWHHSKRLPTAVLLPKLKKTGSDGVRSWCRDARRQTGRKCGAGRAVISLGGGWPMRTEETSIIGSRSSLVYNNCVDVNASSGNVSQLGTDQKAVETLNLGLLRALQDRHCCNGDPLAL